MEKTTDLERQRQQNAIEMDKRIAHIAKLMADPLYPMSKDSTLRSMTDEQLRAYIRERRKAFEPVWAMYQLRLAREASERIATRTLRD